MKSFPLKKKSSPAEKCAPQGSSWRNLYLLAVFSIIAFTFLSQFCFVIFLRVHIASPPLIIVKWTVSAGQGTVLFCFVWGKYSPQTHEAAPHINCKSLSIHRGHLSILARQKMTPRKKRMARLPRTSSECFWHSVRMCILVWEGKQNGIIALICVAKRCQMSFWKICFVLPWYCFCCFKKVKMVSWVPFYVFFSKSFSLKKHPILTPILCENWPPLN